MQLSVAFAADSYPPIKNPADMRLQSAALVDPASRMTVFLGMVARGKCNGINHEMDGILTCI